MCVTSVGLGGLVPVPGRERYAIHHRIFSKYFPKQSKNREMSPCFRTALENIQLTPRRPCGAQRQTVYFLPTNVLAVHDTMVSSGKVKAISLFPWFYVTICPLSFPSYSPYLFQQMFFQFSLVLDA